MVRASVTIADKPGIDSAAAYKTLNFGATPPPPKAGALHGTVVNIRKGHLVSLLLVAICAGNVLTTPLLIMLNTDLHSTGVSGTGASARRQRKKMTKSEFLNNLRGVESSDNDGRVWSNFTFSEMKDHLRCSEYYQRAELPIRDQDAWKEMRRTYVRVVGADASTVGPPESDYNGFSRPYEVGHNSYGRGIYAKADIPKGLLVWHNIRSAAFSEGMQFREFVMTLPPELRCDALQWSYVMDGKIYCDLDEGALCNDGYSTGSNIDIDEEASAKFIAKAGMQLFASRDIKEGEELLCNYWSFSDGDWDLFGL